MWRNGFSDTKGPGPFGSRATLIFAPNLEVCCECCWIRLCKSLEAVANFRIKLEAKKARPSVDALGAALLRSSTRNDVVCVGRRRGRPTVWGEKKNAEVGSKQNKFVCGPQRRGRGLTDVSIFVESWTAVEAAVGQSVRLATQQQQ